ncbi:hypothetical protein OB236_08125 [Paenibacillus sp. WQ 127069]|uniref:Uncharacterized protein n=1 Tax=Paenibacillus baimaensis TaxID=2982185 RepID=A0ABT2UBT7_9BACL|nr:hypothetical protein [Paenibacillus sp. WQ 127069]
MSESIWGLELKLSRVLTAPACAEAAVRLPVINSRQSGSKGVLEQTSAASEAVKASTQTVDSLYLNSYGIPLTDPLQSD